MVLLGLDSFQNFDPFVYTTLSLEEHNILRLFEGPFPSLFLGKGSPVRPRPGPSSHLCTETLLNFRSRTLVRARLTPLRTLPSPRRWTDNSRPLYSPDHVSHMDTHISFVTNSYLFNCFVLFTNTLYQPNSTPSVFTNCHELSVRVLTSDTSVYGHIFVLPLRT